MSAYLSGSVQALKNVAGTKLTSLAQISPLSEMMLPCICFPHRKQDV